jgi:hypothetical protein
MNNVIRERQGKHPTKPTLNGPHSNQPLHDNTVLDERSDSHPARCSLKQRSRVLGSFDRRASMTLVGIALIISLTACPTYTAPKGINVSGQVLNSYGAPMAGVPVLVGGHTPTKTDADGNFVVSGVSTPYDLTAFDATTSTVRVYQGLTRSDPTVTIYNNKNPGPPKWTWRSSLKGTISGPGFTPNAGADTQTFVALTANSLVLPSSTATRPNAAGSFENALTWNGPSVFQGALYGLQWQRLPPGDPSKDYAPLPKSYLGFGKLEGLSLSDQVAQSGLNLVMNPVQSLSLTGRITVPSGYTLTDNYVRVSFDANAPRLSLFLGDDVSGNTNFKYLTPNIPGATIRLSASALAASGEFIGTVKRGLAPDASDIALNLIAAPQITSPGDKAQGISATTPFSWLWPGVSDGVYTLEIDPVGSALTCIITTASTQLTLPDLSALGLKWPSGSSFTWSVDASQAAAFDVDVVASIDRFSTAATILGGTSVTRAFTIAP